MLKFVKQNYDVIWKSFVGSIFMFYFVRFLHLFFGYFFLVVAIYIILFIIAMAIALRYKGAKPAWLVIISFVLGMSGHLIYYKHTCGPNKKDVSVMKPMAEAISNYIVKNGIPKSLEDIPDLPYELEGCNKVQDNVEDCYFYSNKSRYFLRLYELSEGLSIEIENTVTRTGIYRDFRKNNKKNQWLFIEEKSFSSKTTGICNPMRQ